jgi:hypothetical protein
MGSPDAYFETFLRGLASAYKDGEVRPTHRVRKKQMHWWRTRADPIEHTWPTIEQWLETEPGISAKDLMIRLGEMLPDLYSGNGQLRTLQRRVKSWRSQRAKELIFGVLHHTDSQPEPSERTEDIQ